MKTPVLDLKVTPCHNVIGIESTASTTQVCATIKARELQDDTQRAPVDIMVALDVSGSMGGGKLDLCKSTLELLLRQLAPGDSFGLVSFSDTAVIEVPAGKLTVAKRDSALQTVKSLRTRGSTNISAAIGMAAQELFAMPQHNEVQSLFLLTDGQANNGITSADGLEELTKNCLVQKDRAPIPMHCFGYGCDHDDALLRRLSSAIPGGSYYFVQHDSAVAAAFGDALGGILSVVAQNAVLNITIPPSAREMGVKIQEVYHENKIRLDDWNYKVTIGDFYSEESRDVLFLIELSKSDLGDAVPHVDVSISYTDTIEKNLAISPKQACHIARPAQSSEVSAANDTVQVQWLRIFAIQEMAKADQLSRAGQLQQARAGMVSSMETIRQYEDQSSPVVAQLVTDLNQVERGLQSSAAYAQFGACNLSSVCQMQEQQRCSAPSGAKNLYRTKKKASMLSRFSGGSGN